MGASVSKEEDASLNLAVPKHTSIGGRRILDPSATRCSNCTSLFIPIMRKKHYCRRCGSIICEECSSMRHYKQREGGWLFRVCKRCNSQPFILDVLIPGERPWRLIMEFAGDLSQNRVLQVCRRSQLSYHLPYRWGTWEELFTEQQFLAKGANGAVFRTQLRPAVAREFDTPAAKGPVAVKVIQKNSIFSLRKWSHIQRELDTLRICRHPHVIELIGVFQSPDAVFIILEFAQGGDLFDWLVARRKPKEVEVRAIAVQLLGTIFLMHERFGVVHRDIKPENILLKTRSRGSEEPHLKFADFGFARRYAVKPNSVFNQMANAGTQGALLAAVASSGVKINKANSGSNDGGGYYGNNNHYNNNNNMYQYTSSYMNSNSFVGSLGANGGESFDPSTLLMNATPVGTLGFASPEILKAYNDRKQDPTTHAAAPLTPIDNMKKMDIFALGVTLAILLTGQEPFPVNSSRAHVEAVRRGVNFNTRPWQYVSVAAKALIQRMLSARVEDRPNALECLQSEWFEGTAANSYILQHPSARGHHHQIPAQHQMLETEEDVRTFQKSVRSLRNRPDMVYVHNKDGGGVSMSSKMAAKIKEEDHIAGEENLNDDDDDIKVTSAPEQQLQQGGNSKPPLVPLLAQKKISTETAGEELHTPDLSIQ